MMVLRLISTALPLITATTPQENDEATIDPYSISQCEPTTTRASDSSSLSTSPFQPPVISAFDSVTASSSTTTITKNSTLALSLEYRLPQNQFLQWLEVSVYQSFLTPPSVPTVASGHEQQAKLRQECLSRSSQVSESYHSAVYPANLWNLPLHLNRTPSKSPSGAGRPQSPTIPAHLSSLSRGHRTNLRRLWVYEQQRIDYKNYLVLSIWLLLSIIIALRY